MDDSNPKKNNEINESSAAELLADQVKPIPKKGPMSFFSGAMTSGLLAWLCLGISQKIVRYFTLHEITYKSAIAQSAASGFKTLIIGTSFLATFTFTFIACGLIIVFVRSLIDGKKSDLD